MRLLENEVPHHVSANDELEKLVSYSRHLRDAGDLIFQRDQNFREALAVRAVLQRGTRRTRVNPQHEVPEDAFEWTSPVSGSTNTVVDRPLTRRQVISREGEFFSLTNKTIESTKELKRMQVSARPLFEFRK